LISSNCRSSVESRDGCSASTGAEHGPHAELSGFIALQRQVGDAAFDDLDAKRAALNVLRRNDGTAEVKAGGAIGVADGGRNRREIGLRHLFPDIGLIGRHQPLLRYRDGAVDRDMPKHEQRPRIPLPLGRELRRRQSRPPIRPLVRLLDLESPFGLPWIEARLTGLLRVRRKTRDRNPQPDTDRDPMGQRCTRAFP